jgi:GH25 family lysozyme M1 (1,4-beta-N-acetylmuramidase)
MSIIGADWASVDGDRTPDIGAAKGVGVRFAIVRASYGTMPDHTAARDQGALRAAGVTFGAYAFPIIAKGGASPEAQVAAFIASAGLLPGIDLPPILDVEFPHGIASTGYTRVEILAWLRAAVAALREHYGCWPMVYTSARVWDGSDTDCLAAPPTPDLVDCPLWLSRYPYQYRIPAVHDAHVVDALEWPANPKSWGTDNCWLHQYQGDALSMPGFSSTVDLSRFHLLSSAGTGSRVSWVQRRLDTTEGDVWSALVTFQKQHGLVGDGVIGPKTFAALAWQP